MEDNNTYINPNPPNEPVIITPDQTQKTTKENVFKKVIIKIKSWWDGQSKKKKVITGTTAISLILLLLFFAIRGGGNIFNVPFDEILFGDPTGDWKKLVIPQREPPFFTLESKSTSRFGILPQEEFILKTKDPISLPFVEEKIRSSYPVRVSSITDREFTIKPSNPLPKDETVSIELQVENNEFDGHTFDRNYSWAFQTQGKFRVISHIPGDKNTSTPINTGIEIVFSQDDFEDPSEFIQIEPSIGYRLENHSETLAIVPLNPLREKTIYTVTLKKGLNLKSRNDPIDEDFTFTFQTKDKENIPSRFTINENFTQVSPNEPPIAQVYTSNWNMDNTINAEIYKFPSSDSFLASREEIDKYIYGWMDYYAEETKTDTSNLAKVASAELKVQSKDNINYIQLPDPLTEGFYLIQFWFKDKSKLEQIWLQSTTLTGYVNVGKEHTVVWVNEIEGNVVQEATVNILGSGTTSVSNNIGVAQFPSPNIFFDNSQHYLNITKDSKSIILPVNNLNSYDSPGTVSPDDYWSYLYIERSLYKPGDTVNFWGVMKNRDSDQPPSNIEINLASNNYNDKDPVLVSQNLTPNPDGSYIGNVSLSDIPNGWYSLEVKAAGIVVSSTGFQVRQFEKPEMKIEVSTSKKAIFTSEQVEFTASTTFFDETPAVGIPLKIFKSGYASGDATEATTGKSGEISFKYTPTYSKDLNYPRYESITIAPAMSQQAKIEGSGSVFVFGSKLMITTESDQANENASIKGSVNNINLDRINKGTTNDYKGSVAKNQKVSVKTTKTWWEKVETGTYYDFIEKTSRPTYQYNRRTEDVENKDLFTNENGEFDYNLKLDFEKSYEVVLTAIDQDGHPTTATNHFYYSQGFLQNLNQQSRYAMLSLNKDENIFSLNEEVKLDILINDEEYPDNDKNRFLFINAFQGKQDISYQESPHYSFVFQEKYIPNVHVGAVAFTGKIYEPVLTSCKWDWRCSHYYYSQDNSFDALEIRYKNDDSKLDLAINADKSSYLPGDEAKVKVAVTKGEVAVSNAKVNLVLVDQALVALGIVRKPDVLAKLYKPVPHKIYYSYNSHKPVFQENAAEMGGGGGGDEREIFKDTAYFSAGETDENGEVQFNVKLPDNITSWVIFAQSATNDLLAGQTEGQLITSKDYFVTSQYPRKFLTQDKAYVTANSFGKGVNEDSISEYTISFYKDENKLSEENKNSQVYKDTSFLFPDLSKGNYKVSVVGSSEGKKDGIMLPFEVIDNRLTFETSKKFDLEKGQKLDSLELGSYLTDRNVKLLISDTGKGRYFNDLTSYCYISSNRIEKRLAKIKAAQILENKFDETDCKVDDQDLISFQYHDGGLAQVNWGSSHLESTVWATYIDESFFDKEKLARYLEGQIGRSNSGSVQKIYAAWGLSNLDFPQINNLRTLADQAVTFEEKVISAIALADAGEIEKARDIYYDILADYAYEYKPYIRIQSEEVKNKIKLEEKLDLYIRDTGLALLLGSFVDKTYNEGLYLYLRDYRTRLEDIAIDLADIAFIKSEINKLPDENTNITFTSPLRNLSRELKGNNFVLDLSPNEVDNISVSVESGKAEVYTTFFVGEEGITKLSKDPRLSVSRNYKKVKGDGADINPGDIVEITIDFDVEKDISPLGRYTITDHLPSGLSYLENPYAYGLETKGWVSSDEDNIIVSHFYNSPWWIKEGDRKVVYYARVSAVGEYLAEPVIFQSKLDLGVFQTTDSQVVVIKGRE